ncbi:MAG: helix-turn-helix domain-containing protein [archaeon]|jgi:hypothetical protein
MDVKEFFIPLDRHKLWWEKTFLSKLQPNRKINVYFSSNASGSHYFFISQLWFLSKLKNLGDIYYYIIINNQIFDDTKNILNKDENKSNKLSETIAILSYFGIDSNKIHCYYSSDCINKLFSTNSNMPFLFSKSLRLGSTKSLAMPKINSEYEYLESGQNYQLSYYIPKIMDLFISQSFHKFFPEDIDGSIDLFVSSWFGMPILSKIYSDFVEKGLVLDLKPLIISTKKLPFFGHNKKYYPVHIAPSIDMTIEDIYESILIYHVKENHMEQILKDILIPNLDHKYKLLDKNNKIVESTKFSDFKKLPYERKALSLAYSFFEFFKKINYKIENKKKNNYLLIDQKEDFEMLKGFFRSPLTFLILKECDGKTISEISKKLNKHQPNVSKIVSNLKSAGIIFSDKKGKLFVQLETIKIDLFKLLNS